MKLIFFFSGFGDSKAGELLKKIPELEDMFTLLSKVGEGELTTYHNLSDQYTYFSIIKYILQARISLLLIFYRNL